jgi:hypothetical protein
MDLNVTPDEVRAAADRWRMIVNDLGECDAPPVGVAMTWPSAAATDAIHAEAATATEAFQGRISDTAAASNAAAKAYQNREAMGAGEIAGTISAVTSPVAEVAGIAAGSVGAVSSAVIGAIGQLSGAAALGTSSLVNTLAGTLGHVGGPPVPINQSPNDFESGAVE